MRDTTSEAEAIVRAAILRTDPIDRLRQALVLSETMRDLALARLRALHPDRSVVELVELLLGERLIPAPRAVPAQRS